MHNIATMELLACNKHVIFLLRPSVARLGAPVLGHPSRDLRLNTPVSRLAWIPRSPPPDPARATAAAHPTVRPTMRSDLATGRGHTPRIPRSKCSSTENGQIPGSHYETFQIGDGCRRSALQIRGRIVVSISACHAEDPGSIPGRGVLLWATLLSTAAAAGWRPAPGLQSNLKI